MSFSSLTGEAKGSFSETFHLNKTVLSVGNSSIGEMRMESEEDHTGRQMEANTQSGSPKHKVHEDESPPNKQCSMLSERH